MISCQVCHHQEFVGTIFCSECGTRLSPSSHETITGFAGEAGDHTMPSTHPEENNGKDANIYLWLVAYDKTFPLSGINDVTLGRISDTQPLIPDIDLAPYQGYEMGVSRLHATLLIKDDQLVVIDLDSSNGTKINGKKIPPRLPQSITNGDILALGKLEIQVVIKN